MRGVTVTAPAPALRPPAPPCEHCDGTGWIDEMRYTRIYGTDEIIRGVKRCDCQRSSIDRVKED